MKVTRLCLPLFASFVLVGLLLIVAQTGRALGQKSAFETPLNPEGLAFEINDDAAGHLWISDYVAGEIWRLNPASGQVTVYGGLGFPGDARPDGQGNVWFVEASGNWLGQLSLAGESIVLWEAADSLSLFATAIDTAGHIWASDGFDPDLYRLDPAGQEMCRFGIPSTVPSLYLQADERGIWLVEGDGEYIFLLDLGANQYTQWALPVSGYPFGIDLAPDGDVWWTDYTEGTLNRLAPASDELAVFTPAKGNSPAMISAGTDQVWYTDDYSGTIGIMTPSLAPSATQTLIRSTVPVTPTCASVSPGDSTPVAVSTATKSFAQSSYEALVEEAGWTILQLPVDSAPYGIRQSGDSVWATDYGRQILARLPLEDKYWVYLPGITR